MFFLQSLLTKVKVPPRFELGSLDSKSRVLTITPWDLCWIQFTTAKNICHWNSWSVGRVQKNIKAPARFELAISCLLDRRFNQLSHGANTAKCDKYAIYVLKQCLKSSRFGYTYFMSLVDFILQNEFESLDSAPSVGNILFL